jgi:hypothetical protein
LVSRRRCKIRDQQSSAFADEVIERHPGRGEIAAMVARRELDLIARKRRVTTTVTPASGTPSNTQGYNISVAIVDRAGNLKLLLVGDGASAWHNGKRIGISLVSETECRLYRVAHSQSASIQLFVYLQK